MGCEALSSTLGSTDHTVDVVKITDFVETLIFALRATLKKGLEESASHHVIFFCAAALGEPHSAILLELHIGAFPSIESPSKGK